MGFGKSRPPSPGQTDSEADTSNVSNDANQAKSPPVPNHRRSFIENSAPELYLLRIVYHHLSKWWRSEWKWGWPI